MKRLIGLLLLLLIPIAFMAYDTVLSGGHEATVDKTQWRYVTNMNKKTGSATKIARVMSSNSVVLAPNVDNKVGAMLMVSNKGLNPSANRVTLFLTGGSFDQCGGYLDGACFAQVSFDDEPSVIMSTWRRVDLTNKTVLIRDADRIIERLKTAKKLSITLKSQDQEPKKFEFEVSGFEWILYDDIGV